MQVVETSTGTGDGKLRMNERELGRAWASIARRTAAEHPRLAGRRRPSAGATRSARPLVQTSTTPPSPPAIMVATARKHSDADGGGGTAALREMMGGDHLDRRSDGTLRCRSAAPPASKPGRALALLR